jgi:hypothetical protein
MEEVAQAKYIEQLNDIKQRGVVFQAFSKGTANAIYEEATVEVVTLQLWRMLELMAFGFVLSIGEKAIPTYASFVRYKNPGKFFAELYELKADFFPQPIIQSKDASGNWKWDKPTDGTYLTAEDFVTLFVHCDRVIEPRRVGAPPMLLSECKAANIRWFKKIVALLNAHLIHRGEFAYLFQMGATDAEPTCTPFKAISVGDIQSPVIEPNVPGTDVSLAAHLRRQINYLRRSCELYDAGHLDDAVRLAVCIRVLIHDTPKSTSLLTLMGIKSKVRLATSFDFSNKLPAGFTPTSIIPLFANSAEGGVSAPFELPSPPTLLSVDDWWSEVVWIQGQSLNRKQIVLASANKEGGAHVDTEVSTSIQELRRGLSIVSSLKVNGVEVGTPENYHFILLRQFAHELLNSESLLSSAA